MRDVFDERKRLLVVSQENLDSSSASTVFRLQLALAVTEAIGPLRVAATIAATPRVAELLRGNPIGRNVEAFGIRFSRNSFRALIKIRDEVRATLSKSSLTNRTL